MDYFTRCENADWYVEFSDDYFGNEKKRNELSKIRKDTELSNWHMDVYNAWLNHKFNKTPRPTREDFPPEPSELSIS